MISGGAPQVFLRIPGTTAIEDFAEDDHDVVRFARLPRRSELRVPNDVEVVVREIAGNFQCKQFKGLLRVNRVAGNVALDTISNVEMHSVSGHLRVANVKELRVHEVKGDAHLENISDGEVDISSIGGNGDMYHLSGRINIRKVGGNLMVVDAPRGLLVEVGGDAVLDTSLSTYARVVVHATSNVTLRTYGEINARFVAQTSQGEIRTQLPLMVERGRRRNLVGVIGHGDATVTLLSKYGDITIIAGDSDEKEYSMSNESAADHKEHDKEGPRTWEGGFGRHRFRAQWDRGPQHARFHFQGPFTADDDPDGIGSGFSPDFGFEWERGRGARVYGEYEERLDNLREKAERAAHRAAERAKRYAERATRHVRDADWETVERDVRKAVEKAMSELEEAFANMRHEWNKRREEAQSSGGKQSSRAQRVHIEYDEAAAAPGEDTSDNAPPARPLSRDERDAQRRAILEELRAGTISVEEAEGRLNNLR